MKFTLNIGDKVIEIDEIMRKEKAQDEPLLDFTEVNPNTKPNETLQNNIRGNSKRN